MAPIPTLEGLAGLPLPPDLRLDGVSDGAYTKIREQARIQLEGRTEGRPKHELLLPVQERMGLLALPEPSPGDLFFDIESDPHALGEGLEYLFGWVDAEGEFTALWALDPEAERRQFEAFIDGVMARLERWPDLHVYHYAAYEQTALKRLASRYGTREEDLDRLLRGEVLVDLRHTAGRPSAERSSGARPDRCGAEKENRRGERTPQLKASNRRPNW